MHTERSEQQLRSMATGAVGLTTPSRNSRLTRWCGRAAPGTTGTNHSHLTELLREREGIDLGRPSVRRILAKAGIGSPRSRRSRQHRVRRPCPRRECCCRLTAATPLAGRGGAEVCPAAERRLRHRHRACCNLPPGGGRAKLLPAHEQADPAARHIPGHLRRPPSGLQIHWRYCPLPGGPNPVRKGLGGTGDPEDLCRVSGGQGQSRARHRYIPGPAGNRTTLGWRRHHRRSQRGTERLPPAIQ